MATPTPTFRDLSPDECRALLERHSVGRLAMSFQDRVDIMPVHYVHDAGWLYGRTALGTKLETTAHNRWVAFEVDEVSGLFDWQSVVVKGGLYLLHPEGSPQERQLFDHGVAMVRRLVPEALTPADPIPERAILFRIHMDQVIGRGASSS